MKIAHLAPPWISVPPKNYGGTEVVIANLVEEQMRQGHDVTLLAPGDAKTSARLISFFPRSLIDEGVPWQAHLKAYYHYYKAAEYVKKHHFDILHAHLSSSVDMYIYPLASLLGVDTPILTTLHSRFPFDRVQSWTGNADEYYLEWLAPAPIVAISESARAEVPYPLNFVGVVHHGLPMETFQPTTSKPKNMLAWLGRIVADKGPHHAIQAAKAAGIPLVLAGTVDRHEPEAVQYFNEMVKPHIDGQQVQYIGPVNLRQKINLLSQAKGFLNPIEWEEPFGMVMIEAMAVGCPVITFARGAAPELVTHNKTGFIVHDVHEMQKAIADLGELDRSTVRAHAERYFSVRTMTEKYIKIYKRVIAMSFLETSLPSRSQLPTIASSSNGRLPSTPTLKKGETAPGPYSPTL